MAFALRNSLCSFTQKRMMAMAFLGVFAASQLVWAEDEKALETIVVEGERPTELGQAG